MQAPPTQLRPAFFLSTTSQGSRIQKRALGVERMGGISVAEPTGTTEMVGIAIVIFAVCSAVAGLVFVRHRVPLHILREQHDVAGASFAVIGGFYGVLLAFVLVASWERFEHARADTEFEANALADLNRQVAGIPEPTRTELRIAVRDYLQSVVNVEFETMTDGKESAVTQQLYYRIWDVVLGTHADSSQEVALFQTMLEKLNQFSEGRRYRMLYMQMGLPPVIWVFLIVFGMITVGFTYFFGMPRLAPHVIITVTLASTIACTLYIIDEMQTPFSGLVTVPDRAYRVVLQMMSTDPTR